MKLKNKRIMEYEENDQNKNIILAHKHCTNNKQTLINDNICGCFHCMKIFNPKEITSWLEVEETAICPYCGIDSIIGESSGFPITMKFLAEMHKYWF